MITSSGTTCVQYLRMGLVAIPYFAVGILIAVVFGHAIYEPRNNQESNDIVTGVRMFLEKTTLRQGEPLRHHRWWVAHASCIVVILREINRDSDGVNVWNRVDLPITSTAGKEGIFNDIVREIEIPVLPPGDYSYVTNPYHFNCSPGGNWQRVVGPVLRFTIVE